MFGLLCGWISPELPFASIHVLSSRGQACTTHPGSSPVRNKTEEMVDLPASGQVKAQSKLQPVCLEITAWEIFCPGSQYAWAPVSVWESLHLVSAYRNQCHGWTGPCASYDCKTPSTITIRKLWNGKDLLLTGAGNYMAYLKPHSEVTWGGKVGRRGRRGERDKGQRDGQTDRECTSTTQFC